jgi:hypothetical protein
VLCPPHLAEQWQRALREQFHLDAELVLAGTAGRLERGLASNEALFERYPITVVSTDYIKQDRRRSEFLRTCPELVIVDEAHTCTAAGGSRSGQLRHQMLREIIDPAHGGATRHLVLVTATPHSGSTDAFRSLLGLLDPELEQLPPDLSGDTHRKQRERVAAHLVQRRRGDLTAYMQTETPFPTREISEDAYELDPVYEQFIKRVVDFCQKTLADTSADAQRHRIRWWSALALLRSISSSPAAAVATLRTRAGHDLGDAAAIEDEGRRAILDLDDESTDSLDVAPGAADDDASPHTRRLLELARDAEALVGKHDRKLARLTQLIDKLLADGYAPIVFCRFIPTVAYVADHLRKKLKDAAVAAVDGSLPPEDREARVAELGASARRVLVCTDCLSEGINLQDHMSAVVHYDLAWNPTRHEQREGRVDRYGQPRETVRTLTFYGRNNPVDGIVLEVLLRKHAAIQKQTGVTVPIPGDTELVGRAIMQGLILRKVETGAQLTLGEAGPRVPRGCRPGAARGQPGLGGRGRAREEEPHAVRAPPASEGGPRRADSAELVAIRRAVGDSEDVEQFVRTVLPLLGATARTGTPLVSDLGEVSAAVKDALGGRAALRAVFRGRPDAEAEVLVRTHPVVTGLARYVVESALDPAIPGPGRRCGVVRTRDVAVRTTLLLLRLRFHLHAVGADGREHPLLAEETLTVGFTGTATAPTWLDEAAAEALLAATPAGNIDPGVARDHLKKVLDGADALAAPLRAQADARASALLEAHRRVRRVARAGAKTRGVDVLPPIDILGVYVYLPAGVAS